MNPQEIAWLEEHTRIELAHAQAAQAEEAWRAMHERTAAELEHATETREHLAAHLEEHAAARPEPDPPEEDEEEES